MSSTDSMNTLSSGNSEMLKPRIQMEEHGEFPIEDYPPDIADQLQEAAFDKKSENTFVKRQRPVNGSGNPEIIKVEIEQDRLKITSQDIVGIVDLTPTSQVQINPKIGWKEILDIFIEVQEEGDYSLDYHGIPIQDFLSDDVSIEDIFVVVAVNYLGSLEPIFRHGFIREFDTKREDAFDARGTIDIEQSLRNRTFSQGIPKYHFVQKVVDYSTPPNRLIYQAGLKLKRLFQSYSEEYNHEGYYRVFSRLETVLREFESKGIYAMRESPSQLAEVSIYDLPRQRGYYQKALEISKTILSSFIGEPLDEGRENLTMDYILSMENLFEKYSNVILSKKIESLKKESDHKSLEDVTVEKESHTLFEETSSYNQQPDHIIRQGEEPVAILDTKYYSEEEDPLKDTYSRSRLLGYGYQLQVDYLGFLCPFSEQSQLTDYSFIDRPSSLSVISPDEFSVQNYKQVIEEYLRELLELPAGENVSQILECGHLCLERPDEDAEINSLNDVYRSDIFRKVTLQQKRRDIISIIFENYSNETAGIKDQNQTNSIKINQARQLNRHIEKFPNKYDSILPIFFATEEEKPNFARISAENEREEVEGEQIRFYCFQFNEDGEVETVEEEKPYIFDW